MPSNKIISLTNPNIKRIVQLRDRTKRKETDLTIIEGAREVLCACAAKVKLTEIYFCPAILKNPEIKQAMVQAQEEGAKLFEVNQDVWGKISYGERQEGVLAVGEPKLVTLNDLKLKSNSFLLVVEHLEKPGNLGAILRTCEAGGVGAVIICDQLTDPYNPNVIRASLGAVFSVPVVVASNEATKDFLCKKKITVYAATPQAQNVYTKCDFTGSLAIVVGNEEQGLTDFWMNAADQQVKIPMAGKIDSLNVSVTAALVIYEVIRQRDIPQ